MSFTFGVEVRMLVLQIDINRIFSLGKFDNVSKIFVFRIGIYCITNINKILLKHTLSMKV